MENACPDRECRDELKVALGNKLSVKNFIALSTTALIIIGIVTTIVVNSYSEDKKTQTEMIKSNSSMAHKIETDVTIIKTNQEYLHGRMKKLGIKLDAIQAVQQEVLQELIKINTQMKENGGRHNGGP